MKTILSILVALCLFAAPSVGQIVKALSFNTSNGVIVYTNTNVLTFNNPINLSGTSSITGTHGGPTITMQSIIQSTGLRVVNLPSTNLISNGTYDGTNYYLTVNALGTNVAVFRPTATEFLAPVQFNNTTNAATTRTNLGLGATNNVTFSNIIVGSFGSGSDTGFVGRNSDGTLRLRGTNVTTSVPAFFGWDGNESTAMSAEIARTNLGLPLPALTNNSNVTMMRALSGSTNTNEPYSGSISVVGTNNTNTLVFSNGILQSVQ